VTRKHCAKARATAGTPVAAIEGMRPLLLIAIVSAACSNESPSKSHPTSTLAGKREHQMLNCPSAVPGALTKATDTDGGVDITITARDPAARESILARAHKHERMGAPKGLDVHDGSHRGAGAMGFCPIIHANTTVDVEPIGDGVILHITAPAADRDALRKATAARVDALAKPNA